MQISLEEIIKIQPRGVLTIPKKLRDISGLLEDSLVRIKADKGRLVLESVRTLPYPVRTYQKEDLRGFFDLDDRESKQLKRGKNKTK